MRIFLLLMLALGSLGLMPVIAHPPDIAEKSPDGKWLFRAHWYGNDGYLWDMQNLATRKAYFTQEKPRENEGLPARVNALWSPNHRYLAINFYYGRMLYGVDVIALLADEPKDHVTWPNPNGNGKMMIKPKDRPLWNGAGVVNCTAEKWENENVLVLDFNLHCTLEDKHSGAKFSVDSDRTQSIRFNGLKGKVIKDSPPEYEKEGGQ